MRTPHHRVEERASWIRVDLDQLRAACGQVKVVPQQSSRRTRIVTRDFRRPCQRRAAEIRRRDHGFHRTDDARHLFEVLTRDEHRHRREQMRMRVDHGAGQTARAQIRTEPAPQSLLVQAEAIARAIQRLDRRGHLASVAAAFGRAPRHDMRHFRYLQSQAQFQSRHDRTFCHHILPPHSATNARFRVAPSLSSLPYRRRTHQRIRFFRHHLGLPRVLRELLQESHNGGG